MFASVLAISVLWAVNLLIVLLGWPFLLYGKLKYRKPQAQSSHVS